MALTNCPDCGRQISDQAQACPQCGHPLKSSKNVYITNAKKGKGKKIIGVILIFLSLTILGSKTGHTSNQGFGGLLLIIGLGFLIYGKIEHWWHWK